MIYEFDTCVLDTSRQELRRDGELVHVEPQVLAVLEHLAANGDRVVTKIELLDEVWGDRFVSESALTSRIKLARRACGDNGREQRILKTVHSRGYRFVVPVRVRDQSAADAARPEHRDEQLAQQRHRIAGARSSRRGTNAVVGRDDELARLDEALSAAATGRRRAVFVRSGIGSGKSALVAEFLERHEHLDGWTLARGQCLRTRGGVEPYFCLLDALAQLGRDDPSLVRDTLERAAPSWLSQLPSLVDAATHERLERRLLGSSPARMLREGADAFVALAEVRPLALVLEDLHLADDCTLDAVDLLLQRTDSCRLLLIGTTRPDSSGIGPVISANVAAGRASEIALEPLPRAALDELVRDRLDGRDVPVELVDIVVRRCEGQPLFAEEIVASWIRERQIELLDGEARAAVPLDELETRTPPTLRPLVDRELASLSRDELDVLEACAVAGDAFDAATVAAASGTGLAEVERRLASLERDRGLIAAVGASSWPDGTISASYAFSQPLFREIVHDATPANARAVLHARAGAALERGYGEQAAELSMPLADHFLQAGDVLRAVTHLRRAGERAAARSAHRHAAQHFVDALHHLDGVAASPERDRAERRIRTSYGPVLVATEGWFADAVSSNYERVLELCKADPGCPEAAAARYGLATVSELGGRFERTEALLTPLLSVADEAPLALEAHELVACSTFHQGAFDRSLDTATTVLEAWDEDAYSVAMARIAEHPASSCSSWSSLALWALGRSDDALQHAERAVELGEQNRYALSTAVQQRAMFHQLRGEIDECIEWADRCRQVGEDQDYPMRTIQADIYKGWALGVSGGVEDGLALVRDGVSRFHAAGASLNEAYYLGMYADVLLHAGDHERAAELLTEALRISTSRTYFYDAELHRLLAHTHTASDHPDRLDRARAELDESRRIAQRQHSPALELRTVVDRAELESQWGDPGPWRSALTVLLAVYEGQAPTPDTRRASALLPG